MSDSHVMKMVRVAVAVSSVILLSTASRAAQNFPEKPARIIVNLTPGGGVDAVARIVAQHYNAVWKQPFIVDNRPGAGGVIGIDTVAKAAPDGYTLLVCSSGIVTNAVFRPEGYDPVRDFQPVTKLTANPYLIVVNPTLKVNNIKELIALAKSKQGGISYASSGSGSILHMGGALLSVLTGVPMLHVPYRGVADAYPAVVSGQVDWLLGAPLSALPLVKAGRLNAIAVTSAARSKFLPDLPTVAESGVPGYDVVAWFGMFAPAHLPRDILAKLNLEAARAMNSPEVAKRMEIEATDIGGNSPQEFGAEVKAEFEKWRDLVKKTGIKL